MTQVQLGEVQETLLIPLYGRAVETRKPTGLLYDPSAVEMVAALDYDFSKFDGKPSLPGACLRTLGFDSWVADFLRRHPRGTVIELGVGLNTRYERLDNGQAHWLELDLPDTMALRRQFFEESSNRHFITASVTEPAWMDIVASYPGPYCFCSEAMLIYLPEPEVRGVLERLAARFPGSELLLDTMSSLIQRNQHRHDVMKDMKASFAWSVGHPRELEGWGPYKLLETVNFYQLIRRRPGQIQARYRLVYTLANLLFPPLVNAYRINRLQLGAA